MTEVGTVDTVRVVRLGSFLTADAALAATAIVVDDLADFSEDGGWLIVNDQAVQYTAGDDDTGELTLATGLDIAGVAGDRVDVLVNGGVASVMVADVWLGDADETVECTVPVTMRDRLPESMESGLSVLVDTSGGEFVLVDIRGAEPLIDGSFIDPLTTVPPEALTDGLVPSLPPQNVEANAFAIRAGRITWEAPSNPDPLTYRVYVSDTTGVTDADELARTTGSLSAVVDSFGGETLDPTLEYFVVVYADDADGPGPASSEVSFTPRQADVDDISADYVYAGTVEASQIQTGTLGADIAVAGSVYVAEYDDDGLPVDGTTRIRMDATGFETYDSSGNAKVSLPVDGTSVFRGDVEADHLTVTSGSIQGGANELAEAAVLTLQKGVTTPKNPPGVTIDYETVLLDGGIESGLTSDGVGGWYGVRFGAGGAITVTHVNSDGSFSDEMTGPTIGATQLGGLVRVDSTHIYVLAKSSAIGWAVHRFTDAGGFQERSLWAHDDGSRDPAIGYDAAAGEILIAQSRATDDKVRIRRYTYNAGLTLTNSATSPVDSDFTLPQNLSSVLYGSFDFGASRYIVTKSNAAEPTRVMNTSGVRQDSEGWQSSTPVAGMHWDGTNFYSLDTSHVLRKYEADADLRWTTSTDENWYAAYTWYRATGTLESLRSPYTAFTMKKRARLTVQTAPLPVGGSTPPSEARVYLKKGSSSPGTNQATQNMTRQTTTATGTPPAAVITDAGFASSNNPTASGFGSSGNAATIQTGDGSTMMSAADTDQSWTPVLQGGTTNPTGYTSTGRYRTESGEWAVISFEFVMPSNANAGTGQYIVPLPSGVTLRYVHELYPLQLRDVSANDSYTIFGMVDTGGAQLRLMALPDTALATGINRIMTVSVPVAIGVGDKISGTFRAQLA